LTYLGQKKSLAKKRFEDELFLRIVYQCEMFVSRVTLYVIWKEITISVVVGAFERAIFSDKIGI